MRGWGRDNFLFKVSYLISVFSEPICENLSAGLCERENFKLLRDPNNPEQIMPRRPEYTKGVKYSCIA